MIRRRLRQTRPLQRPRCDVFSSLPTWSFSCWHAPSWSSPPLPDYFTLLYVFHQKDCYVHYFITKIAMICQCFDIDYLYYFDYLIIISIISFAIIFIILCDDVLNQLFLLHEIIYIICLLFECLLFELLFFPWNYLYYSLLFYYLNIVLFSLFLLIICYTNISFDNLSN